jgi:tetrathionate reductase subunit B
VGKTKTKGKFSRRDVLKLGGTAALAAAATMVPKNILASSSKKGAKRFAMLIDLRRCTGCHACSVSCKSELDVPLGVWRSWVEIKEKGDYPKTEREFLPRLCNHCDDPPCVPVCPVDATHVRDDGTVVVDENKCIGCGTCITACPYNSRYKNPDKGVAQKCDFCIHRVANGVVPSCVNTCPANTRVFGDLNDPKSDISIILKNNKKNVFALKPELKTEPQVFYIKKGA